MFAHFADLPLKQSPTPQVASHTIPYLEQLRRLHKTRSKQKQPSMEHARWNFVTMFGFQKPLSVRVLVLCLSTVFACMGTTVSALGDEKGESLRLEKKREAELYFEKHVRPLLAKHCFECHGSNKQQADLRLDTRIAFFKGNDSGPSAVAGDPDSSRLIQVIKYDDNDVQMPPKGKMSDDEIALLTEWIKVGAHWPIIEHEGSAHDGQNEDNWKTHWAFQPIADPVPPGVSLANWCKSPIDQFIVAKLEDQNLAPSSPADRRTIIRRVYFDLIGLPPTFEEVERFVQSTDSQAYEKLVDRLLQSPHYGERWGRHWLDLARYSDTRGYLFTQERLYKNAFKYRDWVINAFNQDMPYNEFLKYQIAADHMVPKEETKQLSAMGFLTLGRRFLGNTHDIIDDRIDVMCRTTMGLTVACARCHDHKFDPIPQADYYALYGVFRSSKESEVEGASPCLVDNEKMFEPYVFLRGKPGNRGNAVPRQFLEVVAGQDRKPFKKGSGRLELAEAVASPQNPLTARVMVNRVWSHLFGAGFVPTPSDFGVLSDTPTHPLLLDHLAIQFIENNWSLKSLHRSILLSSVYQQKSLSRTECISVDPSNQLLWKMNLRRLDFEAQRDSILEVTENLQNVVGGESVEITKSPSPPRRTIYAFVDRQNLPNVFRTFDFANPDAHSPKRHETTVPQQSLFYLNSTFLMARAEHVTKKLASNTHGETPAKIRDLYRKLLSREPTDDELSRALSFLSQPEPNVDATFAGKWQYGYGEFDETSNKLKLFTPIPHWTGSAWQGGAKLPDPTLGWVMLNAKGGHPGNDQSHSVIRRWTAPNEGTISFHGNIGHASEKGDGIRARLVSSRLGLTESWNIHHESKAIKRDAIHVSSGDSIDFVVDCRTGSGFDSFTSQLEIELEVIDNTSTKVVKKWRSVNEFSGPSPPPISKWARLAQVLLLSNEFVFID